MEIQINYERNELLTEEAKALLDNFYCLEGEDYQDAFARAAKAFASNEAHAQRMYNYVSQLWLMYSSPILSNGGSENNGQPISCFLSYLPDNIKGQLALTKEIAALSVAGGGVGVHNGIRAISKKAPGPIPYLKTVDATMGYYKQGENRRGSCATYLDVSHPDIGEFLRIRVPSGGDSARKVENRHSFHNAVNITSDFVKAVDKDLDWDLVCPHSGEVRDTVRARDLWEAMLDVRVLTGEPYMWFIDVANEHLPEAQKKLGLRNRGSNLCSEISLPTDEERTAVCCLSSVNLEHFDKWKDTQMVEDLVEYLDNVLEYFINNAGEGFEKAVYSAKQERSIGIGAMGFHAYLQSHGIVFESGGVGSASQMNNIMFKHIEEQAVKATERLAEERGECPDGRGTGRRNMHLTAVAPNSNSAIIADTSPSIEPYQSNAYIRDGRAGSHAVKNKHLKCLLGILGKDTDEVWDSIVKNEGSVEHLDFLTPEQKKLFATAWELDQHWLVEHAEQRQVYIDQAQSLNLYFPSGSDKAYINSVHLKAARGGKVKSLYYLRTNKKSKAKTARAIERKAIADWSGDGCVACEG